MNKRLSVFLAGLLALLALPAAAFFHNGQIPGRFIVVFADSVDDPTSATDDLARKNGLAPDHVYSHALKGFSTTIPSAALENIKRDPRVAFVSEDREVEAFGKPTNDVAIQPSQSVPTGVSRINAAASSSNNGAGITVAVIDTGIDLSHPDLAGAVLANKNCLNTRKSGQDDNGHGTHVAGTVAARNNGIGVLGVAPQANLVAVKVLNAAGSGSWSSVICGIDWATANVAKYNIKVANMSLGGGGTSDNNCGQTNNDALHKAICKSRDAGIVYVVAAGNDGADASAMVPAAYNDAVITVSALADSDGASGGFGPATSYGADDTFATFSNYGAVVDLGAPGVAILSTWPGGQYNTLSGTSMATPHVSGAAALYLQTHASSTWLTVRNALQAGGETLGNGHTDPSGLHPEVVLQAP